MKRYLLFAFREYYPDGGINDLKGSYDTIDEIIKAIEFLDSNNSMYDTVNQINVLDTETMKYSNTYDFVVNDSIDYDELNELIEELKNFIN